MDANHSSPKHEPSYRGTIASAAAWCLLVAGCSQSVTQINTTFNENHASQSGLAGKGARVTGVATCASSGCHGKAFDGATRNWQTAYHVWASEDPHRHAFEVLYTERSMEIAANLTRTGAAEYTDVIQDRCLGCHATAARGSSQQQGGVTCESCHGPASRWLDQHYLDSWKPANEASFYDTTDLSIRAAVCTGCHVGPMVSEDGTVYDVNHDLIAAGHPRLMFELDAYLTNYPKHWNEKDDEDRHRGAFHVNVWAAGQEQTARRLAWQIDVRQSHGPWPDFANFECFDCHHAMRAPGDARAQAASKRGGIPRPALVPLARLLAEPMQVQQKDYAGVLSKSWSEPPPTRAVTPFDLRAPPNFKPIGVNDLPAHADALLDMLASWKGDAESGPTWDQAVQFYLALEALARDLGDDAGNSLASAARNLSAELQSQGFSFSSPTQYDSPATFDAAQLSDALRQVEIALEAIAPHKTGNP